MTRRKTIQIEMTLDEAEGLADELAQSTDRGFRDLAESIYSELEEVES